MDIVRGSIRNPVASEDLISQLIPMDLDGTLYLGYPLLAQQDIKTTVDALLISKDYGLIAFSFETERIENAQDQLYYNLDFTLRKNGSLRKGRNLSIQPLVITYTNNKTNYPDIDKQNYLILDSKNFRDDLLNYKNSIEEAVYIKVIEAIQRISSMKPTKKRTNVEKEYSLGAKIKQIEKEVANLDEWQKKAAFEIPDNIQRIRGLAGSGKTVVLALKAAYLHSQDPELDIAVTFYTRSLGQQFKDMINNFYREYTDEEIDYNKLHIIHAWGSNYERGIYSEVCSNLSIVPSNYSNAKLKYGQKRAFDGIIKEVLPLVDENYTNKYDYILIDEAQDMPASFFRLCYKLAKNPKRIVFAYDELQNLSDDQMPSLKEMFGVDSSGEPLVDLTNEENKPRRDIVLPICYRNTKWALTIAHALGFGIYRHDLIQFFNDLDLWKDIGYYVKEGVLTYESQVTLERSTESSPLYFNNLLTPESAVEFSPIFDSREDEYIWVANNIQKNIEEDELDPDDILVIFPDVINSKQDYFNFRDHLLRRNISSNLAGITTDKDTFKTLDAITCSSIYRAKGNEAPMVYVIQSDFCAEGSELIKLRNILFTAITRSRAWVKLSGLGSRMQLIKDEYSRCVDNEYTLKFSVPSPDKIKELRKIHRELSNEEKSLNLKANKTIDSLLNLKNQGALDDAMILKLKDLLKD